MNEETSRTQLAGEQTSYSNQASQHSANAQAAQGQVNSLNSQINDLNARIQYAQNFENGALQSVSQADSTLTGSVKQLGDLISSGLQDDGAGSNATSINSSNSGVIAQVKSTCDGIITRLQQQVNGLVTQRDAAQQTANSESDAANRYSQLAGQVQQQLNQSG